MPHSGACCPSTVGDNLVGCGQKETLQLRHCSEAGEIRWLRNLASFPSTLPTVERGPLRYRVLRGRCASDQPAASPTQQAAVHGWAWPGQGPDPYSVSHRHRGTLSGSQLPDCKDEGLRPGCRAGVVPHRPHHGHGRRVRRRRFAYFSAKVNDEQ